VLELGWQRSSFCSGGGNNCIEIAEAANGALAVRESESPTQIVASDRARFRALLSGVKSGEMQLSPAAR
jgi:hypothetical protein